MNGMTQRASRRRREQRLSRALLGLAAIVFFCGLFGQIAVREKLSSQSKELASVQAEIKALNANAENLDLNINQRHNLGEIEMRAEALGMGQPDESQLRVVSLPAMNGDTSAQTVANVDGEEIQG